jgi:hypothetical protein
MDTRRFDAITRRASVMTLGTVGLATLATLVPSQAIDAKKQNNGKKKKEKAISLKRCKKQVGPCTTLVTANCNQDADCLKDVVPCCEFLGRCDGVGFVTCAIGAQAPPPTP